MRIRGVIDQIEVGKALLLIGSDQRNSVIWPEKLLPEGAKEGDIIYFDVSVDHEETEAIKAENKRRLQKMVRRTQDMNRDKDKDSK